MKEIVEIIVGKKDIMVLEQYTSPNKEVFDRYINIVKYLIKYGKRVYNKGLQIEKVIQLVQLFFDEYSKNVILSGYYNYGQNEELVEQEVKKMVERILNKLEVNMSLEEVDVEASFSTMTGVVQNKTLTLSNGHPTGTETGFASPLLLAILTATIEITTLLYIFLNAME